jgi:hypothetical protein
MKKREFLIAGATTCASAVLSGCVVQPQRPVEQTLSNSRLRGLSGQELAEARLVRQMFMAFSDTKKLPMRTYLTMEAQQLERTIAQMPKVMNDVQMAEVGKQALRLISLYETAKARG